MSSFEKIENSLEKQESKEEKFERIEKDVENWVDATGYDIDEGIKETIIIFNALDMPTSQSCEGHIEGGVSAPWVEISAPNEPEERFIGQDIAFEKVSKKYKIPVEKVKRMLNMDAYWEAIKECSKNEETDEFQEWRQENQKLMQKAKNFLDEFYKNREVEQNIKLEIEEGAEGDFRIHNGGEDYNPILEEDKKLSEEEKKIISEKLKKYQAEMKEFTGFLKDKYFNSEN